MLTARRLPDVTADVGMISAPDQKAIEAAARIPDRAVSAAQDYRTSRPVTARPMIRRWISEVPSKMVKLSGVHEAEQHVW